MTGTRFLERVQVMMPATLRALLLSFRPVFAMVAVVVCLVLSGCTTLSLPLPDGIPAHHLPPEALGRPRESLRTIPLTLLRQQKPDVYKVDSGDILGVWIEGVLGERGQNPPVKIPDPGTNLPPSLGFPIPVREDGTISLPLIEPIQVKGMSIPEIQDAVRKAYTVSKQILISGRERIIIDLQRPRQYHVLVIRQDSGGLTIGGSGLVSGTKRGTGYQLDLPANENDVLNALARTGGFPGLDAKDEVIVERGGPKGTGDQEILQHQHDECRSGEDRPLAWRGAGKRLKIPLRLYPEEEVPFEPEDIILKTGDVLYIDTRDQEVFYTGGILGSKQLILPRDYDLRVTEAISLANGSLLNGFTNTNNLTGTTSQTGIGTPNPTRVTIIRTMPNGTQLAIKVDLNRAVKDPRENILIQPKDFIYMEASVGEAMVAYFTQIIRLNFVGTILRQTDATATTSINAP